MKKISWTIYLFNPITGLIYTVYPAGMAIYSLSSVMDVCGRLFNLIVDITHATDPFNNRLIKQQFTLNSLHCTTKSSPIEDFMTTMSSFFLTSS
jgi:hypothetical protein